MNSTKPKDTFLKLALVACIAIATLCLSPRLVGLLGDSRAVANVPDRLSVSELPSQPHLVTKPIEEIRCGDRIPSELPPGLFPEDEPEPDQATWRLVELEVDKKDGTKVEVRLIRPLKWLQQAGAIQSGTFPISVEELDVEGEAAILHVLPCPRIARGHGQVVTGTFRHSCASLVELHIAGETEPIVCTSGHPIWSVDDRDFVPAAIMQNRNMFSLGGTCRAVHRVIEKDAIRTSVFNIEVAATHTYHVGVFGGLVHNAIITCEKDIDDLPGDEVVLYHGSQTGINGGSFNIGEAQQNTNGSTPVVGLYLTDDFNRAATGYGRFGTVTRVTVDKETAKSLFQLGGPGGNQPEFFTNDPTILNSLSNSMRELNFQEALAEHFGGTF